MRAQHAREFRIARTDNLLDNTSITSSVSSSGTLAVQAPSAASSQNVVAKIPTSTIALAIAMSCLGLALILVIIAWKLHCKRRKAQIAATWLDGLSAHKPTTSPAKVKQSGNPSPHEPQKAFVVASTTEDASIGWVPQTRLDMKEEGYLNEKGHLKDLKGKGSDDTLFSKSSTSSRPRAPRSKLSLPKKSSAETPPPSYTAPSGRKPADVSAPPTPPAQRTKFNQPSFLTMSNEPTPSPLKSPARSESFKPSDIAYPPIDPNAPSNEIDVPRLMSVSIAFSPSLADELLIRIGDVVRMLEEYRDGWCLVEHIGRTHEEAPRGVVPRFCLKERKRILPPLNPSQASLQSSRR